jgi:hypothetical protein
MNKKKKIKKGSAPSSGHKKAVDLKSVLQEMMSIKDHLAEQSYSGLEMRSRKLRKDLERLEEYDLLLTLYNWMFDCAYTEDQSNIDKSILENFVSVTQKAGVKQDHTDQISTAHILLNAAENGNADRVLLFESYSQLAKLLIRHDSVKFKYKTLITILRICPFLENRNKYVDPYIDFVRHQLSEIVTHFPEDAHILYYSLAVFSKRESLFTRLSYIDQAIELAANHLIPDKEVYYRLIKSEIYCDDGDFAAAIQELDIVDHIIFTNQHFSEQLKNIAALSGITRLLIYYYLELQKIKIEKNNYNSLLKKIENNCSHWSDFEARKKELQSLLLLKKGKREKAADLIKEAFLLRKKEVHPQMSNINLLLHELLKEEPGIFRIKERIEELEKANELFYSSVWTGILKGIAELQISKN